MATTVAHGLIGITFYCAARSMCAHQNTLPLKTSMLFMAAIVANVPDMDMLASLLLFGDHRVLHGGVSHTLLFAVVGGVMVWLMAKNSSRRKVLSLTTSLILSSHVLVDFFTGPNIGFHPTYGAAPLWPVVESRIISPLTLFKGVEHSRILPGALVTAFWEFVFLAPVTALIVYVSSKDKPGYE